MAAAQISVEIVAIFSESSDSADDNENQRLVREPFTIRQISERRIQEKDVINLSPAKVTE